MCQMSGYKNVIGVFISRFTVSNNFEELLIKYNIEYNVNFSKLALIRDIA